MQFLVKPFHALTTMELYFIYRLRSVVFVVEQNCAYQDPDEKDLPAQHVMLLKENTLAGYARLLPPGISYAEPSIGRVVTDPQFRRSGIGRELMKFCINRTLELFPGQDIVISAQLHLLPFYSELGFVAEGEPYLEDNIPHVQMRYKTGQIR